MKRSNDPVDILCATYPTPPFSRSLPLQAATPPTDGMSIPAVGGGGWPSSSVIKKEDKPRNPIDILTKDVFPIPPLVPVTQLPATGYVTTTLQESGVSTVEASVLAELFSHKMYPELMTEEDLIHFLRIPQISRAADYHNAIEHLKRAHDLPCIHICGQPLYPIEAVREWVKEKAAKEA